MAQRRTRVVLSIPWDDEDQSHPCDWGYETLLNVGHDGRLVVVVDWAEVEEPPTLEDPV